ncbi:unnamed protein product [Prunus armeniaca]
MELGSMTCHIGVLDEEGGVGVNDGCNLEMTLLPPYFEGQIDRVGWYDSIGTICRANGCNYLKKKMFKDPIATQGKI